MSIASVAMEGRATDRPRRLLTGPEVEEILGKKRTSIFEAVRRGDLVAVRLGRSLRFRPEDVDAYIERNLTAV